LDQGLSTKKFSKGVFVSLKLSRSKKTQYPKTGPEKHFEIPFLAQPRKGRQKSYGLSQARAQIRGKI